MLLLDTDLEENAPDDRRLTDQLYGGDDAYRLKQEILLGIGGVRLLRALGFEIHTYHLNEGHSALLALDLLKRHRLAPEMVGPGELAFDTPEVREMCVFTTHTPVEAGHDRFSYPLVERVLGAPIALDQLQILAGRDALNMTRLALNLSGYVNGVAERHAETAHRMFPGFRVRAVTNGVHAPTWTHPSFARLYRASFPHWQHEPDVLVRANQLADEAVWTAHQEAKQALIAHVRDLAGVGLDPDLPTIGFARRMTGYKRPDLLFTDLAPATFVGRPPWSFSGVSFAWPTLPTVTDGLSPHWISMLVTCVGSHFATTAPKRGSKRPPFLPVKIASSSRRWSALAAPSR